MLYSKADRPAHVGVIKSNKLMIGRGYIVEQATPVATLSGAQYPLMKLYNPWNDLEWTGAWADEYASDSLSDTSTYLYKIERLVNT